MGDTWIEDIPQGTEVEMTSSHKAFSEYKVKEAIFFIFNSETWWIRKKKTNQVF